MADKTGLRTNKVKSGYSNVNGLKMYYEIYGQGKPLVLIHGGGSTIQTSFGRIIPKFAKHRKVIALELQAHGRTNDRNTYLTFKQDADDVAELLKNLKISKADFLGFSNGGQTLIEVALRHPKIVNKLIICSAFYNRNATIPQFWEGFSHASLSDMPQVYQDEFLKINSNPGALLNMFHKDVQRMKSFKGWSDKQIASIKAPVFILNGTSDVGSIEHLVEMHRLIQDSQLAILPGGHGAYIGEMATGMDNSQLPDLTVLVVEEFLDKKVESNQMKKKTGK
jgi:pimeloyl-ACP methyl ester carboxylesterase